MREYNYKPYFCDCGCMQICGHGKRYLKGHSLIVRNKSEKAREISRLMGKEKFIRYNKSDKHRNAVKGNENWKTCFFTEKCREARKRNMTSYNRSEIGRKNSSEVGKSTGKENIIRYNKSEKHKDDIAKSEKHKASVRKNQIICSQHKNTREAAGRTWARIAIRRALEGLNYPKTKYFYSKKNDKTLYYHSTWELAAFEILERFSAVKSYDRCRFSIPYELEGKSHIYIPDVIITYEDGNEEVIEVKPSSLINHPTNLAKIDSLKRYCSENSLNYSVWTEDRIFS